MSTSISDPAIFAPPATNSFPPLLRSFNSQPLSCNLFGVGWRFMLILVSWHTAVAQVRQDFGDAPAPFPTLLREDGARHTVVGPQFGALRDLEPDGLPDANALGDDNDGLSDEDGVTFVSAVVPGQLAMIQVAIQNAPSGARLDAWVDFDLNGSWAEEADHILTSRLVTNGVNIITFFVPSATKVGITLARFRISQEGGLSFTGAAPDGEVEDYQVVISAAMDFGDAPSPYPTLLSDNGARHRLLPGFFLGVAVDAESNGQPNATATGDDTPTPLGRGDEDGVTFTASFVAGQTASIRVVCSLGPVGLAKLNAWMDFNANGSWNEPGDQVLTDLSVTNGTNNITFAVPLSAAAGITFARFRLNAGGKIGSTGFASEGEVEDYQITIIRESAECSLDCQGRDFWLTFPGNYAPDAANPVAPSLTLQGAAGTTVGISVAGIGFATNVVIPTGLSLSVALPKECDLGNLIDVVTNRGIHVVASAPIGIVGFNHAPFTTDSFLALHTAVLGNSYVVMGFGNLHSGVPSLNGSQFAIVGTETNTVVQITPTVTTAGHPAGSVYAITLQPGDIYQLRSTNDAPADLSGTRIRSSKPIAVFSGHQCASNPSEDAWFCNHLVEQLLPVNAWGNDFYAAPLATQNRGYTLRLLAAYDGTVISSNGVPVTVLNRGQFMQSQPTVAARFTATQPIFVTQYASSGDWDGNTNSDPFMLTVQAVRHFSSSYRISIPQTGFPINFVNLIASNTAISAIQIDGVPISGLITSIGTSGYSYTRVPVTTGSHLLTNSSGNPFGASVYGWSEFDGYGHPACFFLGDVRPPVITTTTKDITRSVNDYPETPGLAPTPNWITNSVVQDNCIQDAIVPVQTPKPGTLLGPGQYLITLAAVDNSGNIGEASVTFSVLDPSPVVLECPSNMVVNCNTTNGAVVNFAVRAHTAYVTNLTVVSTPPSGSVFPTGTTTVTNLAVSPAGQTNTCVFSVTVRCEVGTKLPISFVRGQSTLTLTWPGTATLEFTPSLGDKWGVVTNGVNSYSIPLTGSKEGYFRLRL